MEPESVKVNRAPVMALWGAAVAERLGYDADEALSLGQGVSVLNARSKGRRLGVFPPGEGGPKEAGTKATKKGDSGASRFVEVCGRPVPIVRTRDGVRASVGGETMKPAAVRRYLEQKFGDALPAVREAMRLLARSRKPAELKAASYDLYERFRPSVPAGTRGWGARGELDVSLIRSLARGPSVAPADASARAPARKAAVARKPPARSASGTRPKRG